jgi:hypothetical protein
MLDSRVLVFAQGLPALGNLLANTALTVQIQTVLPRSAHAELGLRQRLFTTRASFQFNCDYFRWSRHAWHSIKMI